MKVKENKTVGKLYKFETTFPNLETSTYVIFKLVEIIDCGENGIFNRFQVIMSNKEYYHVGLLVGFSDTVPMEEV